MAAEKSPFAIALANGLAAGGPALVAFVRELYARGDVPDDYADTVAEVLASVDGETAKALKERGL